MYSNKGNVNILTRLLVEHGVLNAVVCPGSRNAPIVHNLNEHPRVTCYPVTDERSAGFYALGIAQCLRQPVVACVTSGSALLNLAPAVAEAYYQHVPLIVVSADRPACWIDQLDGQTLPQPDALGRFVRKAVTLPEPVSDEEHWYCGRLINEAMTEALRQDGGPVHINVPISEPLFNFTTEKLPMARRVKWESMGSEERPIRSLMTFLHSYRPMLLIGQMNRLTCYQQDYVERIRKRMVVLHESLVNMPKQGAIHFEEVLAAMTDDSDYRPDCILYMGDTFVSKRLKAFLRKCSCTGIRLSADGKLTDTFMGVDYLVEQPVEVWLRMIARACDEGCFEDENMDAVPLRALAEFHERWTSRLQKAECFADTYEPAYSQMAAVKYFEAHVAKEHVYIHYANSTAVRLANIYARHHVWCNRGVNGIEGSLSTAAGFSVATDDQVFCIIGDLSFFYDQNALWNQNLRGNLRILLLNNGKGGIFNMLGGLEQSPARDCLVAAQHATSAEGICLQNDIYYQRASDMSEMRQGIDLLLSTGFSRPMLLEVITDAATDTAVLREYYQQVRSVL